MLQAMNTGHDGSLSTGHANSTYDMISRLETMVLQGAARASPGGHPPADRLRRGYHHPSFPPAGPRSRKTMEIVEILGYDSATHAFRTNTLYEFRELPQSTKEKVWAAWSGRTILWSTPRSWKTPAFTAPFRRAS